MAFIDTGLIRERVVDLRKSIKLNQQEVANFLGLTRTAYVAREKEGSFSWEELKLLADLFDITPFFIKYGWENKDLIAIVSSIGSGTVAREPGFTIFDDLDDKLKELGNYSIFVTLDKEEQDLIINYVNSLKHDKNTAD